MSQVITDYYPHTIQQLPGGPIELTPRDQLAHILTKLGRYEDALYAGAALGMQASLGNVKKAALLHRTYDYYASITLKEAMVEALREHLNPFDGENREQARITLAAKQLGSLLNAQGVHDVTSTTLTELTQSAIEASYPHGMQVSAVRG
jgi:hypothetical protein